MGRKIFHMKKWDDPILPCWRPVGVEWIVAPEEYPLDPWPQSAVYPPIRKLKDGRLVLDRCYFPCKRPWWAIFSKPKQELHVKVWRKEDHPSLSLLPITTPRVVKRLYQAEFQLYLLRMTHCEPYNPFTKAQEAWEKYLAYQ